MAKTKRRRTTRKKEQVNKADPKLPQDILDNFLAEEILVKEISNVSRIRDNFLWEKNNIQRFRINVWIEERVEGRYCPKVYIKHSFFVHYNKETKQITDKTIEQTIDLETMKKRF
jgi:hypothetical protein